MNRTSQKDWTVMIYMAGDNDLDDHNVRKSEAVKDLRMIKKVGSTDRVSVLAQLDRAVEGGTQRFHLKQGGHYSKDVVCALGETNTGDPRELIDFLDWGMREHPARHYLVVLWGHGAGALDVDYLTGDDPPPSRLERYRRLGAADGVEDEEMRKLVEREEMEDISKDDLFPHHEVLYDHLLFTPSRLSLLARDRAKLFGIDLPDDGSLDYLDNRELRFAFETIKELHRRNVDVVAMDACLMSMVEIGFQLRGLADYMIGSQELVPKDGFPYDRILRQLTDNPAITPRELSLAMVKHYINSFEAKYNPTLAVCDLTKFNGAVEDSLVGAIDHLAATLLGLIARKGADAEKAKVVRAAILHARGRAQYFDLGDYVDIYHFCDLLEAYWDRISVRKGIAKIEDCYRVEQADIDLIKAACRRVKDHFGPERFVIASDRKGRMVRNARGLSIYFPIKGMDPTYRVIDFVKETVWQEFIDTFVKQIYWLDFLKEFAHNPRTPFHLRISRPLD